MSKKEWGQKRGWVEECMSVCVCVRVCGREGGTFCSCTWGDNNSVQHLTDTFLSTDISLIRNIGGVLSGMMTLDLFGLSYTLNLYFRVTKCSVKTMWFHFHLPFSPHTFEPSAQERSVVFPLCFTTGITQTLKQVSTKSLLAAVLLNAKAMPVFHHVPFFFFVAQTTPGRKCQKAA